MTMGYGNKVYQNVFRGRRSCDRMVVGFTTTCAIEVKNQLSNLAICDTVIHYKYSLKMKLLPRTKWHYTITALCVGFPTQRAVIVLLYFCQCFIGYLPCGGYWVVRRGTIGVVRRGTIGLFPGSANFGKTSQLFYYHMTNLIQSKSII